MFNSNNFLLSKIIDSDENYASDKDMTKKSSSAAYDTFRRTVSTLDFSTDETADSYIVDDPSDKRTHSIKAILKTEQIYLERIKELLTDYLIALEKIWKGKKDMMNQVQLLMDNFPRIYDLHRILHDRMLKELRATKEIGVILFEFLSQSSLLDVYRDYIDKYSYSLDVCKIIRDKKLHLKHAGLSQIEAIIMSPIQRFPQLTMAISDLNKHTPDNHKDKTVLHRAVCISKSITARLDLQRREFEYTNFTEMEANLSKLKLQFSSKKLLTNNSVYIVLTDFHIPRKIAKVPYFLILCDKNVVMLPKDLSEREIADKMTFCYSLDDVHFNQNVLSRCRDQRNNFSDFEEVKDLYHLINDSFSNDDIIEDYGKLFNDYKILMKINEDLTKLKFRYRGIDTLKISKSLVQLEQQLNSKEMDMNLKLGSILTLNINAEDKKVFLFDSLRQSNEWKMNFNRAKLLSNIDMSLCWKQYSFSNKQNQLQSKELPLQFPPFWLKDNGINDIPAGVVLSQSVALTVGLKVYRCLWVCLANGWIIILHFDYKIWKVLESFKMQISQPISAICVSECSFNNSPDHEYDSEIWLACGDKVLIHSLLDNQRNTSKKQFQLSSDVTSLCRVDNKMLVATKSKNIYIYSRCKNFWLNQGHFSIKNTSYADELRKIYNGPGCIYVLFKTKIAVCQDKDGRFPLEKIFESVKEITTLFVTPDGVWITIHNSNQVTLYDKSLNNSLQVIELPLLLYQSQLVGSVTSICIDEKYSWLGTENGFIICVSTIDSLYCTDNNIPLYFCCKSSAGPITQIIPFQNIHGVTLKCPPENVISKKEPFDQMVVQYRRSTSDSIVDDSRHRFAFSCHNISKLANDTSDDSDSLSSSSLLSAIENLKTTTPMLILAFGSGITNHRDQLNEDESVSDIVDEQINQSTLFTFLE